MSIMPEVIIHTAAMTQADECERQQDLCHRVNVEAVEIAWFRNLSQHEYPS
jgi:dTDP-4-dehydrorhamnose reductase